MLQSFHQSAETFEIMFNKTKYDALPAEDEGHHRLRRRGRVVADMSWKAIDRYSKDYIELQAKDKVKFYKTPDADPAGAAQAVERDHREEVGREPAVQGNRRIAEGLCRARGEVGPGHLRQPSRWPWNHFFGSQAPAPKKA